MVAMGIVDLLEKYLSDDAEDVDGGDDYRRTGDDGARAAEHVGILERAHEDGHLGNEAGEAGKSEVSQTGDDVAAGKEGHDFHQSAQVAHVAGVGTAVDHSDEGEEEGRHESVGKHLQDGTGTTGAGHHEQGEEHQAAVAHRRVGIDVLQVGLHACAEGSVDYRDGSEDKEYPAEFLCSLGEQVHGHAEAAIASEFHQHAGMEHRHSGGRRGMTVGRPGVEREQGPEDSETDEDEGEEYLLDVGGNIVLGGNLGDNHGVGPAEEVDAEDADDEQRRASHKHEGKLHGCILAVA